MTKPISSVPADTSKKKPRGKPFAAGDDSRRNTKGTRAKNFEEFREKVKGYLAKTAENSAGKPVLINGERVTNLEALIIQMIHSKNPRERQYMLEVAFGKVPEVHELSGADGKPLKIKVTLSDGTGD